MSEEKSPGGLPADPAGLPPPPSLRGLAVTLGLIGVTALGLQVLPPLAEGARPLLFLVSVLILAVAFGFWTGLLAAVLAFFALNYLFTEPLYTFHIARPQDLFVLLVFLLVAALAGLLAGRLHDRAEAARTRAEALAVLSALSADLAAATTRDAALRAAVRHLGDLCGGPAFAMGKTADGPMVLIAEPQSAPLSSDDLAAAERCLRTGRAEAGAAPGWPGSLLSFLPVAAEIALAHSRPTGREGPRRVVAARALAEQVRLALQRMDFAEHARAERLRAEEEATRSAVLTSFSHDLRTPLATILGAASALKELDASLAPEARADLLSAIAEEAGRMNDHVTNLLQLTRLELATEPRRDWVDLNDIATAAAARARRSFPGAEIVLRLDPTLPMLRAEGGLLEQALFNLIDNALHHGAPPVTVETAMAPDGLRLTLTDTGTGPGPAILSWLSGPDLRPAPGQRGLGLAVAKGIARHLGGRLTWSAGAFALTFPEPA